MKRGNTSLTLCLCWVKTNQLQNQPACAAQSTSSPGTERPSLPQGIGITPRFTLTHDTSPPQTPVQQKEMTNDTKILPQRAVHFKAEPAPSSSYFHLLSGSLSKAVGTQGWDKFALEHTSLPPSTVNQFDAEWCRAHPAPPQSSSLSSNL